MGTRQPSKPSSSKFETLVNLDEDQIQVQESPPLSPTDGRTEGTPSIYPMEVDEEKDEVVREINVFVNPSLLNKDAQLCLMQYPFRPSWRPYGLEERCTEVRVKPRLSEVEVVLSMDVNSENYDKDVAEPMRLQKQTLTSSSSPSPVDNYAVGMLIGDQQLKQFSGRIPTHNQAEISVLGNTSILSKALHLNPLHAVLQFHPSLGHLNDDSLQKASVEGDTKSYKIFAFQSGSCHFNSLPSIADPIAWCWHSSSGNSRRGLPNPDEIPDDECQHQGKSVSEDSRLKIDDTEPWVSLEYNALGSTSSRIYEKQMVAQKDGNIEFTMKRSDYVKSLCLVQSTTTKTAKVPSKSFLPSEPLKERLKEWLRGHQVNRFDALLHLDPTAAKDEFLKLLQDHAYLVQGLWVSKSSLLCEGYAAAQRDYLLFLFSRNLVIHKSELKKLHLDSKPVNSMLGPLAKERPSLNDWKFREERDLSFIKGHLPIVTEQESGWASREKLLTESLHDTQKPLLMRARISSKAIAAKRKSTGDKVDTRSNNNNDGEDSLAEMAISNEKRESLSKALLQIFKDRKARSIISIQRELQSWALSEAVRPREANKNKVLVDAVVDSVSYPSSILQFVISQIAVKVHDVYVLKSGENPSLDPVRLAVIKLFQNKESNAKVRKNDIKEAVRRDLQKEISDSEYSQVVKDLCVSNKSGAWLLRRTEQE